MRSKIAKVARDYYYENGFIEIETPMMIKSTPEGARDYLVPSRVHHGKFYALPQSPQMYKQLLMIAGFDRYIQLARCFRDEDLRADRQPEFTQIDLEMSFVDVEDILEMNEGFIQRLFKEVLDVDVELPLPRLTYKDAMERYGSDKPDTRFGMEICDISELVKNCGFGVFTSAIENGGSVRAIVAKDAAKTLTRKESDKLSGHVNPSLWDAQMESERKEIRSERFPYYTILRRKIQTANRGQNLNKKYVNPLHFTEKDVYNRD